jgi:hypothetical protein
LHCAEDDVWASLSSWGSYLTEVSSTAAQKATAALAETTKYVLALCGVCMKSTTVDLASLTVHAQSRHVRIDRHTLSPCRVVNETVIAPTAQKVQDGSLINDVSKTLWDTTEKVVAASRSRAGVVSHD